MWEMIQGFMKMTVGEIVLFLVGLGLGWLWSRRRMKEAEKRARDMTNELVSLRNLASLRADMQVLLDVFTLDEAGAVCCKAGGEELKVAGENTRLAEIVKGYNR